MVSVWDGNWFYLCGRVEIVTKSEILEIASVHAVFTDVAEKMVEWQKRLGEYPTPLLRGCHAVLRPKKRKGSG